MGGAADEIDRVAAQRFVALVDREEQFELNVEPLLFEEAQFDRRRRGKIRVGNQVGDGELHDRNYLPPTASRMAAAVAMRSASRCAKPSTCRPNGSPSSSSSGSDTVGAPSSEPETTKIGSPVQPRPIGAAPVADRVTAASAMPASSPNCARMRARSAISSSYLPSSIASADLSRSRMLSLNAFASRRG